MTQGQGLEKMTVLHYQTSGQAWELDSDGSPLSAHYVLSGDIIWSQNQGKDREYGSSLLAHCFKCGMWNAECGIKKLMETRKEII